MRVYALTAASRPWNLAAIAASVDRLRGEGIDAVWLTDDSPAREIGGNTKKNALIERALAADVGQPEPGWLHVLDDDNALLPGLGPALLRAVREKPNARGLAFRQVLAGSAPRPETWEPALRLGCIDAGQLFVRADAVGRARWPGRLYEADWWWLRDMMADGLEVELRDEACCGYN